MLFADTMAWFFVIVGLLITFPSLWLLCTGLWPNFVERASHAVSGGIIKSFLIGIPVTALAVFIVIVVGKLPASFGQIGGVLSFSALMLFAQTGVAGLAKQLGLKLFYPEGTERPCRPVLRGGAVLVLSYLLPLVGWFLILPASIIIGAGSATRACLAKRNKSETESKALEAEAKVSETGLVDKQVEMEAAAEKGQVVLGKSGSTLEESAESSGISR